MDRERGTGFDQPGVDPVNVSVTVAERGSVPPLMELVVEFWPNHYQALYHAGAAAFERGELELASDYLERFLVEYAMEDGWRSNALAMLAEIG